MKVYIAVGGIGCSILRIFQEKEQIANEQCYYIDTDCAGLSYKFGDGLNIFQIGTVAECVSQGSVDFVISENLLQSLVFFRIIWMLFKAVKKMSDVELVFITTSFGEQVAEPYLRLQNICRRYYGCLVTINA